MSFEIVQELSVTDPCLRCTGNLAQLNKLHTSVHGKNQSILESHTARVGLQYSSYCTNNKGADMIISLTSIEVMPSYQPLLNRSKQMERELPF